MSTVSLSPNCVHSMLIVALIEHQETDSLYSFPCRWNRWADSVGFGRKNECKAIIIPIIVGGNRSWEVNELRSRDERANGESAPLDAIASD